MHRISQRNKTKTFQHIHLHTKTTVNPFVISDFLLRNYTFDIIYLLNELSFSRAFICAHVLLTSTVCHHHQKQNVMCSFFMKLLHLSNKFD